MNDASNTESDHEFWMDRENNVQEQPPFDESGWTRLIEYEQYKIVKNVYMAEMTTSELLREQLSKYMEISKEQQIYIKELEQTIKAYRAAIGAL